MFVFREEYYVERLKPSEGTAEFTEWQQKMMSVSGKAEVIIGKQRHGATGKVRMRFDSRITKFSDAADSDYLPEMRS
jgi:replicative DNA helicase